MFGGDWNIVCFVMFNVSIDIKSQFGLKFKDCVLVFGGD